MKVFFCSNQYHTGKPEQGTSFQYENFYKTLEHMDIDLTYFPIDVHTRDIGFEAAHDKLVHLIKKENPDILFMFMSSEKYSAEHIKEITANTDTVTIGWFTDDHWRFDNFSSKWAPNFNFSVTTDEDSLPKYKKIGYQNIILSQWANNHFTYKKLDLPLKYNATFIGQPHSERKEMLDLLKANKLPVKYWGKGWTEDWLYNRIINKISRTISGLGFIKNLLYIESMVTQNEMIRIYNQSKINLNFTGNFDEGMKTSQIKGRNFEVPGCGGFLLTGNAPHIEKYYKIGQEIECFTSKEELIDKIKFYLNNEAARQKIAQAGYSRTINEHTYEKRFKDIFKQVK